MTELQKVLKIDEKNEVVPVSNYKSIFDGVFPEMLPPVLRSYKAYLFVCASIRKEPLTEEQWNQCVAHT